jgi:uncharacterized membrane protein (UPF0136 family)
MSTIEISAALLVVGGLLAFFYKRAPRFSAWALLAAGIGLSGIVLGITGVVHWSVLGIGIAFPVTVGLLVMFWFEAIRKHKTHPIRTPVVAVALGVMLTTLGGSLGGAVSGGVQHMEQRGGVQVDQLVNGGR